MAFFLFRFFIEIERVFFFCRFELLGFEWFEMVLSRRRCNVYVGNLLFFLSFCFAFCCCTVVKRVMACLNDAAFKAAFSFFLVLGSWLEELERKSTIEKFCCVICFRLFVFYAPNSTTSR